ncbi:hypothetical protein O6H91_14G067400 [Diphasiastrum complanatum]|uniref:Uncharacterized protein n=1 Tax=Diphasiastrum complanatum TaxID=34168 RepID=A0ACC2BQA3_DIPCM|nr:hypothetical protein O6H91_14G067400 [Diphasiastrum complanatum]
MRRFDEVCVERFPQFSRNLIQSWILQGKVLVDGKSASKAGASKIDLIAEIPKYVCWAGYKLEAAIKHFGLNLEGKVVLDSGLSTGGFTDCLLQHGAAFVYRVDVGYGQVAERINKKSALPCPPYLSAQLLSSAQVLSALPLWSAFPDQFLPVLRFCPTQALSPSLIWPQSKRGLRPPLLLLANHLLTWPSLALQLLASHHLIFLCRELPNMLKIK